MPQYTYDCPTCGAASERRTRFEDRDESAPRCICGLQKIRRAAEVISIGHPSSGEQHSSRASGPQQNHKYRVNVIMDNVVMKTSGPGGMRLNGANVIGRNVHIEGPAKGIVASKSKVTLSDSSIK